MSRTTVDRLALGGLALLPFIWYFTPIFTDACYYLGDLTAQYDPWWSYGHDSLREGRFPLWNPYVFGGMPYNVNPENSLFYPLKLPLIFLSFFKAAALLRALNAIVASVGFYLLLRSYRAHPLSAVVGALIFSYGSFMAYEFVHVPYINTAVWFPWQLLVLNRMMHRPALRGALLLAMVTAISFLGGSPGIFLICQLTLLFFLAAAIIRLVVSGRWSRLASALGYLSISVALVVGLTLALLLPAFQFIPHTPLAEGLKNLANFTDFAMIPEALKALLFPWMHSQYGAPYSPNYPIFFLSVPYLGIGAVLLALFNLRSRRYAHLAPVTAAIVLFSILMAMGTRTAFFPWMLERATILSWFRWPHDYLLMAYIALAIAAATGFDALWRERRGRVRRFGLLAAAYALVGLAVAPSAASIAVVVAVGALVAIGMLPVALPSWTRGAAGAILLTLLATELFVYGYNLRIYMPRSELEYSHCREAVDFVKSRSPIGRVAFLHDLDDTFWAYPVNGSMLLRYQEISGYNPFAIERVQRLFRELPINRSWDLFGVEHVITPHPVSHEQLQPVGQAGPLHIYRNTTVLPRVAVPRTVEGPLEDEAILERLRSGSFDPSHVTLFEHAPPPSAGEGSAEIVEYEPERVVLRTEMRRAGFVVLQDVHHPGWKVYVDGVEATLWRANYIFRAVWLPAGAQQVEFVYRPYPLLWPAWISLLCWTGCLVALIFTARWRGKVK